MPIVVAVVLGFVSGLRAMTSLAGASWAARLGVFGVAGTPVAFMGFKYTPILFTLLALGELMNDKLPKTPSRKSPPAFVARLVSGGLVGATAGAAYGSLLSGLFAGVAGAVLGTLGGAAARAKLAGALHRDLPAALLEDAVAIAATVAAVTRF